MIEFIEVGDLISCDRFSDVQVISEVENNFIKLKSGFEIRIQNKEYLLYQFTRGNIGYTKLNNVVFYKKMTLEFVRDMKLSQIL
jgi:hypothetical protein